MGKPGKMLSVIKNWEGYHSSGSKPETPARSFEEEKFRWGEVVIRKKSGSDSKRR